MDSSTLLADPEAIRLEQIIQHPSSLTLAVRTTSAQAECSRCHRPSTRLHSYYTRSVADPPLDMASWFSFTYAPAASAA
jgi:transposase